MLAEQEDGDVCGLPRHHRLPGVAEIQKVPMIAGQSATYIVSALTQYKGGERKHPTMRAIADALSEQDIDLAATTASSGVGGGAPPSPSPATRRRCRR
jgi:cytochrome c553